LVRDYGITDDAGRDILKQALESRDLAEELRLAIAATGVQVADRFGQLKSNPMLPALRDAKNTYLQAMKLLHLDLNIEG
jgi:hypothetical protein